ncbi:MAG: transglycosylase SLT domain-containing protein [Candidatus Rokuibacteriota bacterium]
MLDDAIFEDARAEAVVILAPGISIPSYPIVVNGSVEALIDHFTARERERFGLWIARSGRYLGMIRRVFRERGLPEELAYTAMIESGFSPRAVSRVGAKGLWQFMEATARRYGLVVNRWVDERFDPVKSTEAAAQYLGDLYGMFGHWFLAQAAYNAGEARVARAIQRAKTTDFWALTQTRHLPNETKMFVPQILAATVITQAPARYGFEVTREPPLGYDEVTVKQALDFETLAALAQVPVDDVRDLNPALRADITPPFETYALRLPVGTGARFEAALANASGLVTWVVHRVGRNQTLADVARIYRVAAQRLAEVNQLRGGRLRGVTELVVPVSSRKVESGKTAPAGPAALRDGGRPAPTPNRAGEAREVVVRRGDTLWSLATRHGLSAQALARLNGRDLDGPLYVGDRLKIQTP